MANETIIEDQIKSPGISRFRTRWGSELSVHEGNPDFVLSLARGLRVIEILERQPDGLSIAEISRHAGLSRAAVRRLLITLGLLGYVETKMRKYRLQRHPLRAEI
jgi:IclR family pca regulon transcriptional regulator